MTDVSLAGAFLAGLISFLSPCVLPLVPGYISMLSGIGVEQLRQGEQPKGGLFSSALSFVIGFSVVFIGFGASASAVGSFLQQHKNLLTPIAGALIMLFGLQLLGALNKMNMRAGIVIGAILVALGVAALVHGGPLFAGLGAVRFYKNFRKYLHAVELFSGALLLFIGLLIFFNKLTWLSGKLTFLNRFSM